MSGETRQNLRAELRKAQKKLRKAEAASDRISRPQPNLARGNISRLLSAGATALCVGFIIASFTPAGVLNMTTAYVMLAIGWLVGVVAIFTGEWGWGRPATHRNAIGILLSIILAAVIFMVGRYEYNSNYTLTHLVPGGEPTPDLGMCGPLEAGDYALLAGGNVFVSNKSFNPHPIIQMGKNREGAPLDIIALEKTDHGITIKRLILFNASGTRITSFDDGEIWTNSNFRSKRPSPSELIVFDDQDQKVLDIKMINKNIVKIAGTFYRPGMNTLIIHDSENYNGVCFKYSHVDIHVDGPRL